MAHIPEDHTEPGTMLWLPPLSAIQESMKNRGGHGDPIGYPNGKEPDMKMFKHPIIVVSRSGDDIQFVVATSFSGRSLEEKFPSCNEYQKYLALGRGHHHPWAVCQGYEVEEYKSLTFENGLDNDKNSFVAVKYVYSMDWRDAQPWWDQHEEGTKFKLDVASLARLHAACEEYGWTKPAECKTSWHMPSSPLRPQAMEFISSSSPSLSASTSMSSLRSTPSSSSSLSSTSPLRADAPEWFRPLFKAADFSPLTKGDHHSRAKELSQRMNALVIGVSDELAIDENERKRRAKEERKQFVAVAKKATERRTALVAKNVN